MLTITPRTFVNEKLDTSEKRALAAGGSAIERQHVLDHLLVPYPSYRQAEAFVRRFHRPLNGGEHGKGQIGGLLGVSNAGKSFVLENYVGDAGRDEVVDHAIIRRALFVNLVHGCTPHDLATGVFRALGFDVMPRIGTRELMAQTTRIITDRQSQVELVVIDDAQYLLCCSNRQHVKQALGFLLGLAKAKTCNVLLGGTVDVHAAIHGFPHAYNQGLFPNHVLHPYRWEVKKERDAFLLLLDAIDARLPFERSSGLAEPYVAATLYRASGGALGSVMQYVKAAAFDAINNGLTHITLPNWELAARDRANPADPHHLFVDALDLEEPLAGLPRAKEGDAGVKVSFSKSRSKR